MVKYLYDIQWLDEFFLVTKGTKHEHVYNFGIKLRGDGLPPSRQKTKSCLRRIFWIGHHMSKHGIKLNLENSEASAQSKPRQHKNLKCCFWVVLETTKNYRDELVNKKKKSIRNEEQDKYEKLEKRYKCFWHFTRPIKETFITTDTCHMGLGATTERLAFETTRICK